MVSVEIEIPEVHLWGVSGSPRKNSNTDRLVKIALEAAKMLAPKYVKTRFTPLADYAKTLRGCTSCGACWQPGVGEGKAKGKKICPQYGDDGVEELFDHFLWSDGLIIGSPTYGAAPTWLMKCFLDRVIPPFGAWSLHELRDDLARKVVGFVTTGATEHGGQEANLFSLDQFFSCYDPIRVSAGTATTSPLGSYYGGICWCPSYRDDAYLLDPLGVRATRSLGKRVAEVAAVHKAGLLAWEKISKELVEENIRPEAGEDAIEIDWDKYLRDPYVGEGIVPSFKIGIPLKIALSKRVFEKIKEYAGDPPKETFFHKFRFSPEVFERVWREKMKVPLVSDGKVYKHDPEFFEKYLKKK